MLESLRRLLRRTPAWPRRGREWSRVAAWAAALAGLVPLLAIEYRVTEREWTMEREVPCGVRVRKTWLLQKGWTVILRGGQHGLERVRVRAKWRGRRVVAWKERRLKTLREPVREVRLAGAGTARNSVNAPTLTRAVRSLAVQSTAYDAGPRDNSYRNAGTTKLGWRTRRGIAAVDPQVIPLRSLLWIEGYGLAWAGDIGGAIKGDRIDLCFNTTEDALAWGRRRTHVYVLQGVRRR